MYLMHGAAETVLYVGKAKSLRRRLGSYRVANPERMARRTLRLLRLVEKITWEECVDEPAALQREAELLLELKPRFNRAGIWRAPPRYLLWRNESSRLEFTINGEPLEGWHSFNRSGGGMIFLRSALERLVWLATNAPSGCEAMPAGWVHGRMPQIAALDSQPEAHEMLSTLSGGDATAFITWINDRTQSLRHSYGLELRDSDLETVSMLTRYAT